MFSAPRSALPGRAGTSYARLPFRVALAALLLSLICLPLAGVVRANGGLQPTAVGQGMCQARAFPDGSVQAQIAVQQTPCAVATGTLGVVADLARGTPYAIVGFTCKAKAEGPGSPWAAAWSSTYYAYNCTHGVAQAAFNWGRHYSYGLGSSTTSGSTNTETATFSTGHHLLPAALGQGMCQARSFADGSVQAQIAVYQATCTIATGTLGPAADRAGGAPYTVGGFTCKATVEGAGSPWAAAWHGTYYAYSCAVGATQVAFNWGRHYIY